MIYILLSDWPAAAESTHVLRRLAESQGLKQKLYDLQFDGYEVAVPCSAMTIISTLRGNVISMKLIIHDNDGQGRNDWTRPAPGIGEEKRSTVDCELVMESSSP